MTTTHSTSDSCDLCPSSFECVNLSSILAIVENEKASTHDRDFLDLYEQVKLRLKAAGWAYPQADTLCRLSGNSAEIRALVDQLINAWNRLHGQTKPFASGARFLRSRQTEPS